MHRPPASPSTRDDRAPERDLLAAEDSHIRSLFSFLLERHEAYSAFVVDRAWTVRMHNRAATDLLSFLMTVAAPTEAGMHGARMETFLPADGESDAVIRDFGDT